MQYDAGGYGAAAPRRGRRSHHKNQNQGLALCGCALCQGRRKQKPRTIEDHRNRYPVTEGEAHGTRSLSPQSQANPPADEDGRVEEMDEDPQIHPFDDLLADEDGGVEEMDEDPQIHPFDDLLADEDGGVEEMDGDPQIHPFDDLLADEPRNLDDLRILDEHFQYADREDDVDQWGQADEIDNENLGLPEVNQPLVDEPYLFQWPLEDEDELIQDDDLGEEDPGAPCAAFQEPALIRNAYIDAFVQKTLFGVSHASLRHQLKTARRTIANHPDIREEEVANMAQSIRTVERRLGVDTDRIITTFTLCPVCQRRYSPDYIRETVVETCINEGCQGVLFTTRKLASGSQRRVSNLTYPFASPIAWIRHMLNLAGISELIQTWRDEQDDIGELKAPISSEEWMNHLDVNRPIGNICDGWGWRATEAKLERLYNQRTGDVFDQSSLEQPIRLVSLPFGISLSLNTDWFQATKEGNYSVGACYLVINNLPRHMRFLRENISLCIVMPGPGEPSDYALDQMLGPLIEELLALQKGVRMTIRQGDPPVFREEVIYAELTQHIADLIARIKMGGGAGVKSEENFCLYCHTRLSSLSVPQGYMRNDFVYRDPQQELQNAYRWRTLPTPADRKTLFENTGNRFSPLHRIPGWYTCTSSPPDAMHLLYLGAMNWIVKQVLVAPGMFNVRRPGDEDPQVIFNRCLESMWMPKNFQRLPPKLGQTRVSIKADQWKLTSRVLYVPLFLAWRNGDEIRPELVPRGNERSPAAKNQASRARLLHQQREKYYASQRRPAECPKETDCFPSRSIQFHYRQVLRFCLAVNIIDKRSLTAHEIEFAQGLLESLCIDYVRHNVQLAPNFHYLMHLEEWLLKTGSVYNTHVWGMERANGIVSRINHNGRGRGILEGTLMRGWWNHATLQNLIKTLRELPNRTSDDDSMIDDLLTALKGGAEHAQQRGTLMAFIRQCYTAYTRLHGIQEPTKLSTQSRNINLEEHGIYQIVLRYCIETWPDAGVFGPGLPQRTYLAPVDMVRYYSYVEYGGIRYGSFEHTSGKGYCYGYIDGRCPVRIDRVLHIEFPGQPVMRSTCALVRFFQPPEIEPRFPWDTWSGHLGVSSWTYGELGELIAISVERFSGTFALFDVPMTYGRYWVTVALDSVSPERDNNDDD